MNRFDIVVAGPVGGRVSFGVYDTERKDYVRFYLGAAGRDAEAAEAAADELAQELESMPDDGRELLITVLLSECESFVAVV